MDSALESLLFTSQISSTAQILKYIQTNIWLILSGEKPGTRRTLALRSRCSDPRQCTGPVGMDDIQCILVSKVSVNELVFEKTFQKRFDT